MDHAEQKSIRDFVTVKRKASAPEKKQGVESVLVAQPESFSTPKRRRVEHVCPGSPERASRGKLLVQMARQKALSSTPTRSRVIPPPVSPQVPPSSPSKEDIVRTRKTARRRLSKLFGPPDEAVPGIDSLSDSLSTSPSLGQLDRVPGSVVQLDRVPGSEVSFVRSHTTLGPCRVDLLLWLSL